MPSSLWLSSHVTNGGITTMHIARFHIRVYLHHVEKHSPPHDLDISLCMGSSESRQASVSLLLHAAFAFQSWLGTEKHKSLFGNIL